MFVMGNHEYRMQRYYSDRLSNELLGITPTDPLRMIIDKGFEVKDERNKSQTQYVDVKSTRFDFAQRIVFSHQEVNFVHQINNDEQYFVYRVFEITETNADLRICNQCLPYMSVVDSDVNSFKQKMEAHKTSIMGMSLAVSPADCFAKIQGTIKL